MVSRWWSIQPQFLQTIAQRAEGDAEQLRRGCFVIPRLFQGLDDGVALDGVVIGFEWYGAVARRCGGRGGGGEAQIARLYGVAVTEGVGALLVFLVLALFAGFGFLVVCL